MDVGMSRRDAVRALGAAVGGCVLQAKMNGDKITLTDEKNDIGTVTIADVKQSNGVIHVIDTVMLPAS